ncbi:hypothetical protein JCM11251_000629 [Rhodosporidiobolus azoricus]
MSGSDSDGEPDSSSFNFIAGPAGGEGSGHRSWGGLTALSGAAGGGRVDGSFLTEPGSYEDFTYPSPFDYTSFAAHSPANSTGVGLSLSRPFSPFTTGHLRTASNPFSPLPSFSPYPSSGAPSPAAAAFPSTSVSLSHHHSIAAALPPASPTPPPLFDEGETALFSSFLNTLDVNPDFLFNPILPPGMPSPPSAEMIRQMEGGEVNERERSEREHLGRGVGGLSLSAAARVESRPLSQPQTAPQVRAPLPALALPPIPLRQPSPELEELEQRLKDEDQDAEFEEVRAEDEDGEDTAKPDDDDDSDFDPRGGGGGGTRKKSRGGASGASANGRNGKKARVQKVERLPPPRLEAEDEEEDVKMSLAWEDDEVVPSASTTGTGRPRRATRMPRRLSSSASSAAVAFAAGSSLPSSASAANSRPSLHRPSLSKPSLSRSPPAPLPPISLQPGAAPPPIPLQRTISNSTSSGRGGGSQPASSPPPSGPKPTPLTESEKRSNHIASEQRRRNAIKSGFQDLVDLLVAGSTASGIVLGDGTAEDEAGKKGGGKGKGKGRGRGRKGEVQANASKSVVLEKARAYILWLERGNRALEGEVGRVEGGLIAAGVEG